MSMFSFCILLFLFDSQFFKASLASNSTEGFKKPSECPGKHSYEREILDCDLAIPQHVNLLCKSWNNAEVQINKDKYTSSRNSLKRFTIVCQRGSPFFLDTTKLSWDRHTYEITYGNQLNFEEISSGVYTRHGFSLRITLPEISKTTEKEVFQFYSQNERGVPKNLTTFTLVVHHTDDTQRSEPFKIEDMNKNQDLFIEFQENSSVACISTENQEILRLQSVYFTNISDSQTYMDCLANFNVDNCTRKYVCGGRDPGQNCEDRVISCSCDNLNNCTLKEVHQSGVILCTTKDEREKYFVEYFTALDGAKYKNDNGDTLAIDKLVKVKLDKENENRLFFPEQWITIKYQTISYPFRGQIYWEYKLKDGHLGSFIYEEERENLPGGMVKLKMKKDMTQILYFMPWSPYPVGSAIDVLVTEKKAPYSSKNVSNVEILGNVGKELLLICEVKANPLPKIKWSLEDNSEVVGNSGRYHILKSSYEEKSVSILRFAVFSHEDVGKYTCTATNAEGVKSITWHVEVKSGFGYEAAVGIVLILIAIILIGAVCYQIWSPPQVDML